MFNEHLPWKGKQTMKRTLMMAAVLSAFVALPAEASYFDEVVADNPLGYYRLNETSITTPSGARTIDGTNTVAVDASGNGNDGLYMRNWSGSVASVPGALPDDTAVQFTGPTFVRAPVTPGSMPFTLEGWFRHEDSTAGTLISVVDHDSSGVYYNINVGETVSAVTRHGSGGLKRTTAPRPSTTGSGITSLPSSSTKARTET